MAIRTKRYKSKVNGAVVKAVVITENNIADLVAYIVRNGGAATGHNGDTASGRPARVRVKQLNYGDNWGKRDWRVGRLGDSIIRYEYPESEYGPAGTEFARVRKNDFEDSFELVK